MRQTRVLMGMPVIVEIIGGTKPDIDAVFEWLEQVDARYSTYKPESEISRINAGLPRDQWSEEMQEVLALCAETKRQTDGYFDIKHNGKLDPSGLVKGWAVHRGAELLHDRGLHDFYLEAGGDIQVSGNNKEGQPWRIGIRNPFNREEIIKVLRLGKGEGVATSGTYIRGQHIYNPHRSQEEIADIKSLTVVGPNIYDADRFATAAFAMGPSGLEFIASLPGFEGYLVDEHQTATFTANFERYVI